MENLEICIAFLIFFVNKCGIGWSAVEYMGGSAGGEGADAGPTTHPRLFRCVSVSARCDSTSNYYLSQPRHNTGGIVPLVVSQGMIPMKET